MVLNVKCFSKFLMIILAVSIVISFSACGGQEVANNTGITKLTMWTANSHSKNTMVKLVKKFNDTIGKEKGIELIYEVKEGDLSKQIEVAMLSGQAPDFHGGTLSAMAQKNEIVKIADLPGGKEFLAKYESNLVESWHTYKGEAYTVPYSTTTQGLIYNKDMFVVAGLVDEKGDAKPPETWDELRQYAKILTDKGNKQFGIILPLMWKSWFDVDVLRTAYPSYGKDYYDPKTGVFDFSIYKPILETLVGLKQDGSAYPGTEGIDNDPARARFSEGNIGMKFGYSWDVGVFNDQFPAKCNWGVAPLPVVDKNKKYKQAYQPSWSPFIDAKAIEGKKTEKVMTAYEWYNSDEVLAELFREGLVIPWKYDIIKDVPVNEGKKGWKEFGDLLEISTAPSIAISTDRTGEVPISQRFLNEIWNANRNIDTVLDEVTKTYAEGIEKYEKLHPEYDKSIRINPNWDISR